VGLGHAHRVHESDLQRFIEARWTSTPNKVFSEKRDFIS
jgi:DNA-directed RNA polymerase specialized sigma54-like protein